MHTKPNDTTFIMSFTLEKKNFHDLRSQSHAITESRTKVFSKDLFLETKKREARSAHNRPRITIPRGRKKIIMWG
jgi:hypothetical protein